MRVEWVGGPNNGLVVDYPGDGPDQIIVVSPLDPAESMGVWEAFNDTTKSRRVRVPVRAGKAIWADREPRT